MPASSHNPVQNPEEFEDEPERRWLVELAPNALDQLPRSRIRQAYSVIDVLTEEHYRLRIQEGKEPVLTRKFGRGVRRKEMKPCAVNPEAAEWMYKQCIYKVEKTRYVYTAAPWTFEIDVLEPPFQNMILAELEHPDCEQLTTLPAIFTRAEEVTHSITNYRLARMAPELALNTGLSFADIASPKRKGRKVILAGGPTSGKTFQLERLQRQHPTKVMCVPEVASIIIKRLNVNLRDSTDEKVFAVQGAIAKVQRQFEIAVYHEAMSREIQTVFTDRGVPDGIAYTRGGQVAFEKRILGKSLEEEFEEYDAVIYLGMPSREVFEAVKDKSGLDQDPAARYETYDEAVAVDARTRAIWEQHRKYTYVPHEGGKEGYAVKNARVDELVRPYL